MSDAQKIQTRYNLGALSMAEIVRRTALMAVNSGNLVLDLEDWGGIEEFVDKYSNGYNVIFALPMLYLDQTAANSDVLVMQLMGIDQDNNVVYFEGARGGKRYYARMTPIDANVFSGPLVITDNTTTPASIVTATGQMTAEQQAATAQNIGVAPLKLTATPTAGPSRHNLMSGTWSGATWEEIMAAVLATRLIQIDVAGIGPVTLLYNVGSATHIASNNFVYSDNGTDYIVFIVLSYSGGSGNLLRLVVANDKPITDTISDPDPSFTPVVNTIYECGELINLTITNPPATGAYSIVFTSGSTPTVTTFPATILGLEDFAAEANTLYEINVLDNRAVVGSWAVSV
jgi:hypothetical protein